MGCRGLCQRLHGTKSKKKSSRESYYSDEFRERKFCSVCDCKIITDGIECPCCTFRLRTRPRNNNQNRTEQYALIRIEDEPFMEAIPQIRVEIPLTVSD